MDDFYKGLLFGVIIGVAWLLTIRMMPDPTIHVETDNITIWFPEYQRWQTDYPPAKLEE